MRKNGQHLIKYSGKDPDGVMTQIIEAWRSVYKDCRIVSLSIVSNGHGLYNGYVVFQDYDDGSWHR